MATLIDRALAVVGWFAAAVQRLAGGSRKAPTRVALALFVLTAIPIALVSTSHRPTDLSFEDMRLERLPGLTSWGRLEGELTARRARPADCTSCTTRRTRICT